MTPRSLTVIAKIKVSQEEALRKVLATIASDPEANRYLHFELGSLTHLANFVILNDSENGSRLLFTSNYDGSLEDYVADLLRIAPGIDEIWNCCEGYAGKASLLSFFRAHSHKAQSYFIAFRDETVMSIRQKMAIREQIESFLALSQVAAYLDKTTLRNVLDALTKLSRKPPSNRLRAALTAVRNFLHRKFFDLVLRGARFYGALVVDKTYTSASSALGQDIRPTKLSDEPQMTNLIDIKPGRLWLLRIACFVLEFLGRYAFSPGNLAGVVTIHFARWVIIDNGKRLLFQSKFDGSWENYMGDFVDKVGWGLDAVWSNTIGYPSAGMQDIDSFKRFIRDRQFHHLYVYCAYPNETVLNLMRDRDIVSGLTANFDRAATERWLAQL